ncbi:hypothetical protein F443_20534 [Phytophthora nicotianae P1569]|uniref:Uncharacterized protein n=1 Tax=Phytophthora nicotianae P1569 TaxID=1317065 RepID=V9E0Q8_PHYNI|nr:hypothetical protein F443_20534 [Phytophthora nicotianae P1569]
MAKLRVRSGPSDVRREHVEHFIETLDDLDLADPLALMCISDVVALEEVLRARQRAKNRQGRAHFGSSKYRQRPANFADVFTAKRSSSWQLDANLVRQTQRPISQTQTNSQWDHKVHAEDRILARHFADPNVEEVDQRSNQGDLDLASYLTSKGGVQNGHLGAGIQEQYPRISPGNSSSAKTMSTLAIPSGLRRLATTLMQSLERSARPGFQPGELPSLTSFRRFRARRLHAWQGRTTDGSGCRTSPSDIFQRRGSRRSRDRRRGSDPTDGPSYRSADRSISSSSADRHGGVNRSVSSAGTEGVRVGISDLGQSLPVAEFGPPQPDRVHLAQSVGFAILPSLQPGRSGADHHVTPIR